ncbi:MAG: hypothetical protein H5T47_04225 [Archaeoglobi archaeon]|nr:hypothetical protein [Candidatus Mnemosynella bozhongmuii]
MTFENLYYKTVLRRLKDKREVAREFHDVWSAELFQEHTKPWFPYFANTVKFLRGAKEDLKLGEEDPVLWGGVCIEIHEEAPGVRGGEVVVCLGVAYFAVRNLSEGEMADAFEGKKVLGIYHPSGRGKFYEYFEDYRKGVLKKEVHDRLSEFMREYDHAFLKVENGRCVLSV